MTRPIRCSMVTKRLLTSGFPSSIRQMNPGHTSPAVLYVLFRIGQLVLSPVLLSGSSGLARGADKLAQR